MKPDDSGILLRRIVLLKFTQSRLQESSSLVAVGECDGATNVIDLAVRTTCLALEGLLGKADTGILSSRMSLGLALHWQQSFS